MLNITDNNFQTEVIESTVPVFLDCYTSWCGPCKAIAPLLEKLSVEFSDKIKICKMDCEANPELATNLDIRSVPTIITFIDGKNTNTMVGGQSETELRKYLNGLHV